MDNRLNRPSFLSTSPNERSGRFPNSRSFRPYRQVDESTIMENPNIHFKPSGIEHPLKSEILARFRDDLVLPKRFEELTNREEVYISEMLKPVSWEEFSQEETNAIATGQFCHHRRGGQAARGRGTGRGGGNRRSEREMSHSFDNQIDGFSSNLAGSREDIGTGNVESNNEDSEEVLWSMPNADSGMGTFDEKGNFTIISKSYSSIETTSTTTTTTTTANTPIVPSNVKDNLVRPSSISVANEKFSATLVNTDTQWYYRDPSGQLQGPFSNKKMLHWYSRKYFPDTLPLRREQDILFEPLSSWKIKCGGICPFDLGAEEASPPKQDPVANVSLAQGNPKSDGAASIFAKLGLPWTKQPIQPDIAAPPTTATSTSIPINPTASQQQAQKLADEQIQFLQQLSLKQKPDLASSLPPSLKILEVQSDEPIGNPVVTGWKKMGNGSKPVDIGETLKVADSTSSANEGGRLKLQGKIQYDKNFSELQKPVSPPPAAVIGWAKPTSAPVKSLCEIMKEEEELVESTRRTSRSPSLNSPKSFADTLRNAEAASAAQKPTNNPAGASSTKGSAPLQQQQPKATSQPASMTNSNSKPLEIKSWCLEQLKPLESSFDINMCTTLLMEFKTPSEVVTFIEDNISNNNSKIDVKSFIKGFLERRFNSSLSTLSNPLNTEDEFVTVQSKSRRSAGK